MSCSPPAGLPMLGCCGSTPPRFEKAQKIIYANFYAFPQNNERITDPNHLKQIPLRLFRRYAIDVTINPGPVNGHGPSSWHNEGRINLDTGVYTSLYPPPNPFFSDWQAMGSSVPRPPGPTTSEEYTETSMHGIARYDNRFGPAHDGEVAVDVTYTLSEEIDPWAMVQAKLLETPYPAPYPDWYGLEAATQLWLHLENGTVSPWTFGGAGGAGALVGGQGFGESVFTATIGLFNMMQDFFDRANRDIFFLARGLTKNWRSEPVCVFPQHLIGSGDYSTHPCIRYPDANANATVGFEIMDPMPVPNRQQAYITYRRTDVVNDRPACCNPPP
jgi:hypothetical protein